MNQVYELEKQVTLFTEQNFCLFKRLLLNVDNTFPNTFKALE